MGLTLCRYFLFFVTCALGGVAGAFRWVTAYEKQPATLIPIRFKLRKQQAQNLHQLYAKSYI
jgi:hypothetical protein